MADPLQLLETESGALLAAVRDLSDDQLAAATPSCPGWTVRDVVNHLATGATLTQAVVRGTMSGDTWYAERKRVFDENAKLPVAELRHGFDTAYREMLATFEGLSPEEMQAMRSHPAYGQVPVQRFVAMRLSESTIHGWDIQAAADPAPRLTSPSVAAVVAGTMNGFPGWFLSERVAGLRRAYRFDVGAPVNEQRTLLIEEGKAGWTSGVPADATLTLDGGDFLLLMTGRLSSAQLVDSGRATVQGDRAAARELSTLFRAYGGN